MSPHRLSRRTLLSGALGVALASSRSHAAADPATAEQVAWGQAFLARHPSVDMHAHPGLFFLDGITDPTRRMLTLGKPDPDRAIADLRVGYVSAVLFSGVADTRLLDFSPTRGLFAMREFAPGEAWQDYRRQLGTLKRLVAKDRLARGTRPEDIAAAMRHHRTACIFAIEGGDFIEDDLGRIAGAHADGVRSITIVHYHNNAIGDIQTQPRENGGLTDLGQAIVREINRTGIVVDVAHASPQVVRDALSVASRPMMASHTNLNRPDFQHPRLISAETARLIARDGGVIGSVPSGIGQSTFDGWIDAIMRLIDTVGIDHVGIGTDMDSNYAPVFTDYKLWHLLPATLRLRGLQEGDIAKVMGGNFQRLFAAVDR